MSYSRPSGQKFTTTTVNFCPSLLFRRQLMKKYAIAENNKSNLQLKNKSVISKGKCTLPHNDRFIFAYTIPKRNEELPSEAKNAFYLYNGSCKQNRNVFKLCHGRDKCTDYRSTNIKYTHIIRFINGVGAYIQRWIIPSVYRFLPLQLT